MDVLYKELLKLNTRSIIQLLNSAARARFYKHNLIFKLWLILGIDTAKMCDELFFYGIDTSIIKKTEAKKRHHKIYLKNDFYPKHAPEFGYNPKTVLCMPLMFQEMNWERLRVVRRMFALDEKSRYYPETGYGCNDNLERLRREISEQIYHECDFSKLLDEAAYFGSIDCFKFLLLNGAQPSHKTMVFACRSGREEIVQLLIERKGYFDEKCLINAILSHNNKIVRWITIEKQIHTSLHSAVASANYGIIHDLLYRRHADVNAKDQIYLYSYDVIPLIQICYSTSYGII